MQFKSYKDMYLFLNRYCNFSCVQCTHHCKNLDDGQEHEEVDYARFLCSYNIAMVEFGLQITCNHWKNNDGKQMQDFDDNTPIYKFNEKTLDILDAQEELLTIEDIEKIIKENR